ncbi:hypothetical protein HNR00_003567 [Methylorubrum rhodinum]|uniref:Uncharacterized protein n=1 Tax=Methylorubrum rhodinum TaxID=29428 RepID=A0A840ZNE2_9HYPH|nr:hypothetical protein [Methylorubrum rhodinum]
MTHPKVTALDILKARADAFYWAVMLGSGGGPSGIMSGHATPERRTRQQRRHAERQARKRRTTA